MIESTGKTKAATINALVIFCVTASSVAAEIRHLPVSPPATLPSDATAVNELTNNAATVYRRGHTMWIVLHPPAITAQRVVIPRLFVPIRSMQWKDHSKPALTFTPGPSEWGFAWDYAQPPTNIIEVSFDQGPSRLTEAPVVASASDGSVMLRAHEATTIGQLLRYEPQPSKNTIGYWTNPDDYAVWDLIIEAPGTYSVAVLQGCGAGQGGSTATFSLHKKDRVVADLQFKTVDTGHFQNFRWKEAGLINILEPGKYQFRIRPVHVAKAALFDVRTVHLVRQAQPLH